nr:hypothetical protein CDS [Bradyrhizobium sp.]
MLLVVATPMMPMIGSILPPAAATGLCMVVSTENLSSGVVVMKSAQDGT